jgi:photosystem II stability/assembly factor-like uncharacterized protein
MQRTRRLTLAALLAGAAAGVAMRAGAAGSNDRGAGRAAAAPGFADPITTPARPSERAVRAPVFALAQGDGGIALGVGPRGHILRSGDGGRSWVQVPCPVSSDLVAVAFSGPRTAWAVGHDGVMLASTDAGTSWSKRHDGLTLGALLVQHYEKRLAGQPAKAPPALARALDDARKAAAGGAALSLLAVWFRNEREGFIAGQFNLLLHTADGGASWQPWLERTDNPENLSLHAIAGDAQQVWIAGELGLVLRLAGSGAGARFERIESPYKGSWFALALERTSVLLVGLRGNAWRSDDGGASWRALATGTDQAINAAVLRADGGVALLTSRGRLLAGGPRETRLADVSPNPLAAGAAYALLPQGATALAVGTARGVQTVTLASPTSGS